MRPDLGIGHGEARCLKIAPHLAQDVIIACLFEIGHEHAFGIGLGIGTRFAKLCGRPLTEHLVPACSRLELQVLIMGKLLLESIGAFVESRHGSPS